MAEVPTVFVWLAGLLVMIGACPQTEGPSRKRKIPRQRESP
jgi:hypothetical protein